MQITLARGTFEEITMNFEIAHIRFTRVIKFFAVIVQVYTAVCQDLTTELNFKSGTRPGLIAPYLSSCDLKLYSGRWYVKYHQTLNDMPCLAIDFVVKEFDTSHMIASGVVNGKLKTLILNLTRIPETPSSFFSNLSFVDGTYIFFYVDGEMAVILENLSYRDGSKHAQNVGVSFRNLDWVGDKQPQLKRILKILEPFVEDIELRSVDHDENCKYLPVPKN